MLGMCQRGTDSTLCSFLVTDLVDCISILNITTIFEPQKRKDHDLLRNWAAVLNRSKLYRGLYFSGH